MSTQIMNLPNIVLLVVLQTSNFWKSLQMSYLTDSGRGSR